MRKFKVGDKVKVVKKCTFDSFTPSFRIGSVGIVTEYLKNLPFPYGVENKNGKREAFKPQELKKI